MHTRLRILALFLVVGILYYWRILIGHQFSLLTGYEGANQAYAWYTFLARSIHSHASILWDPYSFSGHPFVEEMQNGTFYPVNLLLSLFPLTSQGAFSPGLYHWLYALTHIVGAFFMFLLVRELGMSVFAGFVAGLGFGFGGVLARSGGWPHLFQSFIWFPLIFLFVLRALEDSSVRRRAANAATAGIGVALSILAGGLYSAIMQSILIVATAVFAASKRPRTDVWTSSLLIVVVAGLVAAIGSAAQLLPSIGSGSHTLRTVGAAMLPENRKIPYAYISGGMWPHSFITLFLAPQAFGGNLGSGEGVSPYMGALVFALALIGTVKRWGTRWVRFLAGLAVVSFLYSMAAFSVVHGVLYAVIPKLWMAREASRGLYLADFSLPLLAAYGTDALFSAREFSWHDLKACLKWIMIVCAGTLWVGAIFSKIEMSPWVSLSLVLILVSCALLWRVVAGDRGRWMKCLFAGIILFDLYAFDWSAVNVIQEQSKGADQLDRLLSFHSAVSFLRSRPGLFRTQLLTDPISNIGDTFGVETTWGAAATVVSLYNRYRDVAGIWNIGYSIRPAGAKEPGAVYTDKAWKVYEESGAFPRAWIVHKIAVEPLEERFDAALRSPSFNARETALVAAPVGSPFAPEAGGSGDKVDLQSYNPAKPVVDVDAGSDGLLVLSEVYGEGWRATVNGRAATIQRVDGALRGVIVRRGHNRIEMVYRPATQIAGVLASSAAFACVGWMWLAERRRNAKSPGLPA